MSCNPMIAPCGIDCAECEIYKAANDPRLAEETARQWRANGLKKADASWFVCQGCRVDRTKCWTEDCGIYACCVEDRKLDSCSNCSDFACDQLQKWAEESPNHAAAVERLKGMRGEDG